MNEETQKDGILKSIGKALLILVAIFVLLCLLFYGFVMLAFAPVEKKHFSADERAVIASEFDIPEGKISIEKLVFQNGRDSNFRITVTTSSLDVLNSYEYQYEDSDGTLKYCKKDDDDPHRDIDCEVENGQPYEMEFITFSWRPDLYEMVKQDNWWNITLR